MSTKRRCVVATAQIWYDAAHKPANPAGVLHMENAFNHTENALVAARASVAELLQHIVFDPEGDLSRAEFDAMLERAAMHRTAS